MIAALAQWFGDASRWAGADGIPQRLVEHLAYSALALAIAALIAVPLGLWIGHTGKGERIVVLLSSGLRSLPTLGLLTFLVIVLDVSLGQVLIPVTVVLTILAVPPLLAGCYSGLQAVPREVVQAAVAGGHSTTQVVTAVELPNALPMMIAGLRSAALQVLATTSVAAYVGLGGLGRYLFDALGVQDYTKMLAGALLICALALLTDGLLALLQRLLTPAGVRLERARNH